MSVSKSSSLAVPGGSNSTSDELSELDYWEGHLQSCVESGLSQKDYCARHGLNASSFSRWKSRFKRLPSGKSSIKLVEVKSSFCLNSDASSPSGGFVGIDSRGFSSPGGGFVGGGLRFWCGEFCIEVGASFSSACLSQLIETLQKVNGARANFCGVENESCK